jgi:FkbM family methyltransferase
MALQSSLQAFWAFSKDYRLLPFQPRIRQFPKYLWSYVAAALARRSDSSSSSQHFSLHLSKPVELSLQPEHFGMVKGILQDGEYNNLPLPAPPKTIMDLGANIGLAALVLHDHHPQAQFCCVEADPRNHELLLRNLSTNSVPAQIVAAAVGPEPGLLSLRFGQDSTCSTLIDESMIHPGLHEQITVPIVTMVELLKTMGWQRVDLLKIDIEGAEEDLLKSSPSWLEYVGTIVMEIHPNTTPERIADYLKPHGFRLQRHRAGREPVYVATRQR